MIETLSKGVAQRLMNEYGKYRMPFFFLIDYQQEASVVLPMQDIDPLELQYNFHGLSNIEEFKPQPADFSFEAFPVSFDHYQKGFDLVQQHLLAGNSFLTNLTFPTPIDTNLGLEDIFIHSQAPYKLYWHNHFVVFSPEIFVRIKQGIISSYPMKGTIDARLPNARERLLSDLKEKAEHATIVDLIRNDLSMVATKVSVDSYRYLDKLQTSRGSLLQTSSRISGQLDQNYHEQLGDIVFRLLPAGSISGAPKPKTVAIIQEAEAYNRGYYTGVFGHFDGTNLDSAVAIRFVEQQDSGLVYKSGGGITALSRVKEEYEELIQKVYLPIAQRKNGYANTTPAFGKHPA
ncbi:MAG: aminodeoxychorismate synthase component I [Saprospiraceae bacterium]|nr:MAG: aminodeoxychorismate synthase component I [Saprospiraceae bacterium]